MDAVVPFETLVNFYLTTLPHITEEKNLKSIDKYTFTYLILKL